MKKILLFVLLLAPCCMYGYGNGSRNSLSKEILSLYKNVDPNELIGIADSFRNAGNETPALICYGLICEHPESEFNDTLSLRVLCKALNSAGVIYYTHYDYYPSLQLFLKALDVALNIGYTEYIAKIYNNIGGIHYGFKNYTTAKKYYELAYPYCDDAYLSCVVLNNIGMLSFDHKDYKNALLKYKEVCNIIQKSHLDSIYNESLNNIGDVYSALGMFDSAFAYYQNALKSIRKIGDESNYATVYSNLGRLYTQKQKYDSAAYYLKVSMKIAHKYKNLAVLSDNYLNLSKIEEKQGNVVSALNHYKSYSDIQDSLYTTSQYAKINDLIFSYDMSKVNKLVQKLNTEQEVKERTIVMQRLFQIVLGLLLCVVVSFLILFYRKNKVLNHAYSTLVLKNKEILESDKLNYQYKLEYEALLMQKERQISQLNEKIEISVGKNDAQESENSTAGTDKSPLSEEVRRKLEMKILEIVNNRDVFCDPDFSLAKLSEILDSNLSYTSWIINNSFNKNFNTFINEYRIKEACRLFADPKFSKYSIETISSMVGFRHKSSFNPIFKEVTGLTPSYYIRSLRS